MRRGRIAVCDDELLIRLWFEDRLGEAGFDVETFEKGEDLLDALSALPFDLVLLDLRLPGGSGIDLLPRIFEKERRLPVIMITAHGEVETAVRAVRAGAHHFLEKPVDLTELLLLIDQALANQRLISEIERYRDGNLWQFSDVSLVGRSRALGGVAEIITRLALRGRPANVLIRGESGTGKDVVARAIHARGPRGAAPFIAVNCTALPEHLVESELFGHQAGAFTDAKTEKRGLFELADGGTLFLDEVGDMPRAAQAKLLQVLESHAVRRVGGTRDIPVDVHLVAATNRDLEDAVAAGDFREDLYYRLNVVPISIPPLRDRREDVAPLAQHFLESLTADLRVPQRTLSAATIRALEAYSWPGNARQLKNVLERILLLRDEEVIDLDALPAEIGDGGAVVDRGSIPLPVDGLDLIKVERGLIQQALKRAGGNKTQAARLLGLSRDTLRYRVEKFGIEDGS